MPRFDGTGPMRQGPMTGLGRGRCSTLNTDQDSTCQAPRQGVGQGGTPWGCGRGRCIGGQKGMNSKNRFSK